MVNIAPPVYKTLMAWKWNTARDSPGKTSSLQSQFDFLEAEEAAPLSRTRNDPHVWPPSQSQTLPTSTEPLLLKSSDWSVTWPRLLIQIIDEGSTCQTGILIELL